MTDTRVWYYARGNEKIGPLHRDDLEKLVLTLEIRPSTLVWAEGMENWELAEKHFVFRAMQPPDLKPDTANTDQPASFQQAPALYQPNFNQPTPDSLIGPDGLYINAPGRSFTSAISACLREYVNFSGRASRSEYWFFLLFTGLASVATSIIDTVLFSSSFDTYGPTNILVSLFFILPTLSVTWRRLHDINRSGWWIIWFWLAVLATIFLLSGSLTMDDETFGVVLIFVGLFFLVYMVLMFVFACTKGDLRKNRFG